jgi:hypothetical protein
MKKTISLIIFILTVVFSASAADVLKFNSTSQALKLYDESSQSNEWTDWFEIDNTLIVINLNKNKVEIYSDNIYEFDIYSDIECTENDDGKIFTMNCVDDSGDRCEIDLRLSDSELQLYIFYSYMGIVYNLTPR